MAKSAGGEGRAGRGRSTDGKTASTKGDAQNQPVRLGYRVRSTYKQTKGMTLTGNVLSGDTFGPRQYIKKYLGGTWDAKQKAWIVDAKKVQQSIKIGTLYPLD